MYYPCSWSIQQYPHQCLRQPCEEVSPEYLHSEAFKRCVAKMQELLTEAGGAGLAAPQCAWNVKVFVIRQPPRLSRVVINPRVLWESAPVRTLNEGCLSFPKGMVVAVERPTSIEVNYLDRDGNEVQKFIDDFEARVFLHETDHLNGVLFIDKPNKERTMRL